MTGRFFFLAKFGRVLFVVTWPFRPFVRAGRMAWRCVVSLVTLPVVIVDERVTRINLMRTETTVAVTAANLNVARIGEILCSRGKTDAGRECLESVIRAVIPKPVEDATRAVPFRGPVPFPREKPLAPVSRDLKTKGDA